MDKKILGKNIIVFDTETLGLFDRKLNYKTYANCDLLSIAWAEIYDYDPSKKYEVQNYYVRKPDVFCEIKNFEIHGITMDVCERDGIPVVQILDKFFENIEKFDYIISHNIEFDREILLYEVYKNKLPKYEKFILDNRDKFLCTMMESIETCCIKKGNGYKYPSLQELYTHYTKKEYVHQHHARRDVEILLDALAGLSIDRKGCKIYLNVSFKDKDQVKKMGAIWDPVIKKWYTMSNRRHEFSKFL
jgi:DNA polymerase-3 subunit alpha